MRKLLYISLVLNLLLCGAIVFAVHVVFDNYNVTFLWCKFGLIDCPYPSQRQDKTFYLNQPSSLKRPIVMMGDSLTARGHWNELLGRGDVLNHGVGGYTVLEMTGRLPGILKLNPGMIVLMGGSNDIFNGDPPGSVLARIKILISRIQKAKVPLVVQTVLKVSHHIVGQKKYNQNLARYNEMLGDLSREMGFHLVDVAGEVCPNGILPDDLTPDGLHVNWQGYMVWSRIIKPILPPLAIPGS